MLQKYMGKGCVNLNKMFRGGMLAFVLKMDMHKYGSQFLGSGWFNKGVRVPGSRITQSKLNEQGFERTHCRCLVSECLAGLVLQQITGQLSMKFYNVVCCSQDMIPVRRTTATTSCCETRL